MNYTTLDTHLHSISQVLARCGRAFQEAREDDSHTNLAYDPLGDRLVGRWFKGPSGMLLPVINLDDQSFHLLDERHESVMEDRPFGKTQSHFEEDISKHMADLGLDVTGFLDPMHYQIPVYEHTGKPIAFLVDDDIDAWRSYRSQANAMCAALLNHLQQPGEVRIWPNHFDTGILMQVRSDLKISFGLAMDDDNAGMPYYYAAGYRNDQALDYVNATGLTFGQWNNEGVFKGALLPNEDAPEPEVLDQFVREAVTWLLER